MDSELATQQTALCGELENQISTNIEGVRVKNIGSQLIILFDNKSVATVYPVTGTTVDLYCRDFQDRAIEKKDLNIETLLGLIGQIATLQTEQTATGDVSGYSPARAFAASGQTSNRGTQASERAGWQVVNEIDRLKHPFGEDPLGANARNPQEKSRSEGNKKSAIRHNYEGGSPLNLSENSGGNQTLEYLAEMLPVDSAEINGGKLVVTIESASLVATVQPNGNFALNTFVAGELILENENLPASDLIKLAFQICGYTQSKIAERDSGTDETEVEPNDVWETIRELAKASGRSTDPLRNKDLFDLRQGLCVSRAPFAESARATVSNGATPAVHGATTHNGSPVSLNEGRDASRPYADTLGGKVLRYIHGIGCVFVNKSDLPKEKFLSWNASKGHVELVEGKENVKRPSWHWRGWKK
jgi:hypothetical protein